ncbi:phage tail assembly protein [Brucella pseudintermedia]|uniref:Phage tail assembly protein n=1 Tax=Brucella pseudintermedia TaxID=370111 RepID=A0ABY5U7C1_9HYPH|nr:phage tail assembly protein [Brucella pseudintermedia]UWL59245.1 phage tail assembly protein [Brucella pseudintermedia]
MTWKTKAVPLQHPIAVGEKTVAAITLREPDLNALEVIEGLGLADGVAPKLSQIRGIIAALGDQPDEVLGKLHRDDVATLTEALLPFLSGEETTAAEATTVVS